MKHWTESMIREDLDGTFTRLLQDGRVEVVEVDSDYHPSHGNNGRPVGATSKPQVAWTDAEDEILCQMRRMGRPFNEICWMLSRSEGSTKKRFRVLRVKGLVA